MSKPRSPVRRRIDGVLLLDKPAGITSNGALQTVRRLYNAAKGGHTGTLDPMATGLLPLCLGEATKFAGELLDADKAYRATVQLGTTTDTADADGRILEVRPVAADAAQVRLVVDGFKGVIQQVPPMYSALKRDGRPLYELARQGIEVAREARTVTIREIELSDWTGTSFVLDVLCSKGTYIRTLAADIGERLGCGAHLTALRRTRIGGLDVATAVGLSVLENAAANQRDGLLLPVDALLADLQKLILAPAEAVRVGHGQAIAMPTRDDSVRVRLYAEAGTFLGLGEWLAEGVVRPLRMVGSVVS